MKLTSLLKQSDLFGEPVLLSYKGQRRFKSATGGCISILFVLTVIVIFTAYSVNFFSKVQFNSSASVSYITYDQDEEGYELLTNRTTMAVYIGSKEYSKE